MEPVMILRRLWSSLNVLSQEVIEKVFVVASWRTDGGFTLNGVSRKEISFCPV